MIDFGMTFTDEEVRRMTAKHGHDPRERREVRMFVWKSERLYGEMPLSEFNAAVAKAEASMPVPSARSAMIEFMTEYDEGHVVVEISYLRPETDLEVQDRVRTTLSEVREEMVLEAATEARDRAELARLKAKYEGQG